MLAIYHFQPNPSEGINPSFPSGKTCYKIFLRIFQYSMAASSIVAGNQNNLLCPMWLLQTYTLWFWLTLISCDFRRLQHKLWMKARKSSVFERVLPFLLIFPRHHERTFKFLTHTITRPGLRKTIPHFHWLIEMLEHHPVSCQHGNQNWCRDNRIPHIKKIS